jgi:peroxiredoxin
MNKMKNIISILMILLLLSSCNKEVKKTDGYVINGTAKGIYNGIRVYLNTADERGNQISQDTAVVMDETFKFEGKIESPEVWFLSINNVNGFIPIMVENETIEVVIDKNDLNASKITGTKSNEALNEYNDGFNKLMDKRNDLNKRFGASMNSTDSIVKAKLSAEYENINHEISNYPYTFLETNNDNYFSLSIVENILKTNPTDVEPVYKAFSNLDNELKNSLSGKNISNKINALKIQNERLTMLNIGKEAPNFSAPNPDGKQLSLNEIKGKATIIDFWASWCGPCRRENPNVVKVYEKYHDKGLEIISVSLDKPGQKEKWLKAIEDDKLTWHHVSNLQYFQDPVAQQYNIQSIPATYILDADGKIVAKSLRGQALEDKIAEMLN